LNIKILLPLALAFASCLGLASSGKASAQEELQEGPNTLVIHYRASLDNRAAFRDYLVKDFAPKLRAMKAKGELADFRVFYSWYRQPDVWDGMAVLRFPSHAGVLKWNALERGSPGGLDAAGIALADPYATYAADLSWSRNPDDLKDGEVYYVIPYEYSDATQYRDYVKGYILPQFDGWMKTGAVTGYEMYMNRYPVGTPWDALFIQHYRDMAAFGQRQKVTEEVRAGLRNDPVWSAWSNKKMGIRTETENTIAELIAH
jgi:hypothetical protein